MTLSSLRVEFPYGNLKIALFLRKRLICQQHRLELALKKNYSFSFYDEGMQFPHDGTSTPSAPVVLGQEPDPIELNCFTENQGEGEADKIPKSI